MMDEPPETFRGTVRIEQCDHFGHMNVQFYSAALSDGFFFLMNLIGLGKSVVAERQLGLAAVSMEQKFRRELRPGDLYRVNSGFISVSPGKILIGHRMSLIEGDRLALTAHTVGLPMDLKARKRTDMPDDILHRARALVCPPEAFGL
ncbi:acyl-CoA thioesterase [Minwuia sp.]|uniref:acyl-CoA thioesterase n=1 Tax=Minwuia sp. TaxID=2493630 RepID=UPI003A9004B3